ncbi:hypothetical protein U4E84_12225 [Halorubrum sp. AD140]|nr:hypothetical protein [Halorubrum sp. AD140]MDZ5812108.1 hypothetical protein [Halorubrum sp. AD140]
MSPTGGVQGGAPPLSRIAAGVVGFDVGQNRALAFTSVTRNSLVVLPLALALSAGYELWRPPSS